MKHPEKPDPHPKNGLPSPKRDCPECGNPAIEDYHQHSIHEREELDKHTDRVDYWCGECEEYIGGEVMYEGPTPVRTHTGWEMH